MTSAPLKSAVHEGHRISDAARDRDVELRVLGGVAVWMHCPNSREQLLERRYGDVDLVGRTRQSGAIGALFESLGYEPNWTFNRLHKGDGRMMFLDATNERRVDVFLDRFSMCHSLELGDRLLLDFPTLSLADLLLTKLQVVEITAKDLLDLDTLLNEHPVGKGDAETIDADRIASVCASDWGWYRTVRSNLQRLSLEGRPMSRVRADEVLQRNESVPKTRRWKLRAAVGDRIPWYQLPEEV